MRRSATSRWIITTATFTSFNAQIDELRAEGRQFGADMPVGIMVEPPSAAAVADLLARDVAVVDLRMAGRPTLRLTADALEEYRQIKGLSTEVSGQ